ncbi:MAG: hypothetical protein KGM47_16985 [Acidobacteriota bacterium]|nr:hypothetical protein [Acidobacteriota bacterium]
MSGMQWREYRARYVESAAYHEAGHVVVAAVQNMPLQERGVCVDGKGSGVSYYWHRDPGDGATSPRDQLERERTIIALHAGRISQGKFFPDCPEEASASDRSTICELLEEMHPANHTARSNTNAKLQMKADGMVSKNWDAIKELANALLGKTPQVPTKGGAAQSHGGRGTEKSMSGSEVKKLLEGFYVSVTVRQ